MNDVYHILPRVSYSVSGPLVKIFIQNFTFRTQTTTDPMLCRNPLYPKTFDKGFLSNPSNCGGQNKHPGMRNKKAGDHDLDFSFSKDGLHRLLYFYLMGQPLGMIFLALYIFAPKTMVRPKI